MPGHLGLYSLMWVVFLKDYVFTISQLPQIWRIVTCFCITGPKLGLILDPFFLYHYASQLESGSPRFSAPGAFAFYLFFVASVILVSAAVPQDFPPRCLFPFFFSSSNYNLVYLPVQPTLAVTVPGNEEDYPSTVRRSSFANPKRAFVECGHGGIPY